MFGSIMESKIQQWQKEKSQPDYVAPPPIKNTFGKPIEQELAEEIESMVIEASKEKDEIKKDEILKKAKRLEIRLLILFETQGLNLLAQSMQLRLQEFRVKHL